MPAASFYRFEAAIQDVTGFPFVVPTHQGRAADLLLARMMYTGHPEYKYVVTNMAFDSTRGAAMEYNMWAEDLLAAPGYDSQLEHPFKGNMDPEKLDRFLTEHKGRGRQRHYDHHLQHQRRPAGLHGEHP